MVSFTILAGTYTTAISSFLFNPTAKSISLLGLSPAGTNPSWLTQNPINKTVVYATNEQSAGEIVSFRVGRNGALTIVDRVTAGGADPAHTLALSNGKEVISSTYSGGTIVSLPVNGADIGTPGPIVQFQGSGPNKDRQLSPHPHQVVEYRGELLIPDLGSDKVWRLRSTAPNTYNIVGSLAQPAGSGPRHAVASDGIVYTLHELTNTLGSQSLNPPRNISTVSVLPPTVPIGATFGAAEVLLVNKAISGASSTILYATNRNVSPPELLDPRGDTIAIVSASSSGRLTVLKHVYTGLRQIRGFAFSPDGKYVAAAGKEGGGIAIYELVRGGRDLKLVARYDGQGAVQVVSFLWL